MKAPNSPRGLPARLRALGSVLLLVLTSVLLSTLRPVHLHVSNVSHVRRTWRIEALEARTRAAAGPGLRPTDPSPAAAPQVAILFASSAVREQLAAPPPGVLSVKASVHGPMEKVGTPDPRWWLESEHEGRKEEFLGWVDASTKAARQAREANSSADPPVETPPVIYPFCELPLLRGRRGRQRGRWLRRRAAQPLPAPAS